MRDQGVSPATHPADVAIAPERPALRFGCPGSVILVERDVEGHAESRRQ
jgi:hypothetical protein